MLKKLGTTLLTLAFLLMPFIQVSAASGISATEQQILDALEAPVMLNGRQVFIPAQYVNKARAHLMSEGVNLTSAEVNQILANIGEAREIVVAGGYTSFSDISQATLNRVTRLAEEAASVIGLTISVDISGGSADITIVDNHGNVVGDDSGVIRDTGFSAHAPVMVMTGLVATLGACAMIAKKHGLFA